MDTTLNDRRDPALICRENQWAPGTRLEGDKDNVSTVIEITAIGERRILAKIVNHEEREPDNPHEGFWDLSYRDWRVVEKAPTPFPFNDAYREKFDKAFAERFGVSVSTKLDTTGAQLVTTRDDGLMLNQEQKHWMKAYSDGYAAAIAQQYIPIDDHDRTESARLISRKRSSP